MKFLLKNGFIVDGSGRDGYQGSVVVKNGKISRIIRSKIDSDSDETKNYEKVYDLANRVIAPGFIDMHSHADWIMCFDDHEKVLAPLVEQGVTTVIGGNCGFSAAPLINNAKNAPLLKMVTDFLAQRELNLEWESLGSYFAHIENNKMLLNTAMLTGHATTRCSLFGRSHSYPGRKGIKQMEKIMETAFDEGSLGYSLGLGYEPGIFVKSKELEKLARRVKKHNRILTVHNKALSKVSGAYPNPLGKAHNIRALEETIAIARKTGVKLQISHLIFVGEKSWPTCDRALEMIDNARAKGVDIAFDSFPYFNGNTTIHVIYPTWFLDNIEKNLKNPLQIRKLKMMLPFVRLLLGFGLEDIQLLWGGHPDAEKYNGMFFGEIARKMNSSVTDAYLKVTEISNGSALCLLHKYSGDENNEDTYLKVLAHPLNLIETDGVLGYKGVRGPHGYGTFPRIIERYVRERKILTLEEAVAKMSGSSAERFAIRDRGVIKEGNWADITVFDYDEIKDNTTVKQMEERPDGFKYVFINGEEVLRDGRYLPGTKAGQAIRYS